MLLLVLVQEVLRQRGDPIEEIGVLGPPIQKIGDRRRRLLDREVVNAFTQVICGKGREQRHQSRRPSFLPGHLFDV